MQNDLQIVWTNGCFDILHRGHIELFKYAKSLGDVLYVGIDSDSKVKKDKGNKRPYNNEVDRIELLKSIKYIDKIFLFENSKQLDNIIKSIKPNVMVIGSDWKNKIIVGESHSKKVVFFDRIPNYSTTNILKCYHP